FPGNVIGRRVFVVEVAGKLRALGSVGVPETSLVVLEVILVARSPHADGFDLRRHGRRQRLTIGVQGWGRKTARIVGLGDTGQRSTVAVAIPVLQPINCRASRTGSTL